jgi:hypothetical protein
MRIVEESIARSGESGLTRAGFVFLSVLIACLVKFLFLFAAARLRWSCGGSLVFGQPLRRY